MALKFFVKALTRQSMLRHDWGVEFTEQVEQYLKGPEPHTWPDNQKGAFKREAQQWVLEMTGSDSEDP